MDILNTLKQMRDDLKTWVLNNLNALNRKIDEKTIPIDAKLDSSSSNPIQNKAVANEITSLNNRVGKTSVSSQISEAVNNIPKFSGDYNDLTNAPNIAEDNSGDMIIADESGNVIFKADADGIHTTAVSLNGEAAATEKYVDDAMSKVNFTGYATEDFVTSAVESAKEELGESIVSESEEWKVVDDNGNIIFSVDAGGAHTTSMTLNGQSVEEMIDDKVDKVEGKGLSTNDFTNEYKAKVDSALQSYTETDPTVPAWAKEANKPTYTASEVGALPDTTPVPGALSDLTDDADHRTVTDVEKGTWNAKSDFSGNYSDLNGQPEILDDASGTYDVVDSQGNVVCTIDKDGIHTVGMTINGVNVEDALKNQVNNNTEVWTFTLEDGSVVTKTVVIGS